MRHGDAVTRLRGAPAVALLAAALLSGPSPARAEPAPLESGAHERRHPPIDRAEPGTAGPRSLEIPEAARRALLKPGAPLHVHPTYGVPTFLWASHPGRPSRGEGPRISPGAAVAAARSHLKRFALLYGLSPGEVDSLVARTVHDTGRGAIVVAMRARVDGLEVFREEIKVALDRDLQPVSLSGFVIGGGEAGSHGRPGERRRFRLDEAAAAAIAFSDLTGRVLDPSDLRNVGRDDAGLTRLAPAPEGSALDGLQTKPARVKRIWFRLPDRLEPAVYVEASAEGAGATSLERLAYVISARDGTILFRHDMTADDTFTYRVWADPITRMPVDSPAGDAATPHPTGVPDQYQAPFIGPSLITLENGPIGTGDPWLPPDATMTSGNNVDAYADLEEPDGFSAGDLHATTTSAGTFDRVYDTALDPGADTGQRMAAITQLFYVVNSLHDWFYGHGFDEMAGTAQASNYGRGGAEGDALRAEAQDYSGRNNANMFTPADGEAPVMQMYIFDGNGRRKLEVDSPASISGTYTVGRASFGPRAFLVSGLLTLVDDGLGVGTDGCSTPYVNAGSVSGRIALVDRGNCGFTVKVKNAQMTGALGVIVVNNASTGALTMGGLDDTITIPSLFISLEDGETIKSQLAAGVSATMDREAVIDHDGTIDNQIITHEWGHYISGRLVGNGSGLANPQGRGMAEGWADFHALLMTVQPEDTNHPAGGSFTGAYAIGGYVCAGGAGNGGYNDGYYFGLRRYPYSIDFAKDPLTFRHIAEGEPLPSGPPLDGDASGAFNNEVHGTGEVWATMLWEGYAAMLRDSGRLTFEQARGRMADYLVAAYKMTPLYPTFLEARDALLAAAWTGDAFDHALLSQAFARRGAGYGAIGPSWFSRSQTPVNESYVTTGALAFESGSVDDTLMSCDNDGVLDAGETGVLTLTLRNTGGIALASTTATITSPHPGVTFPSGAVVSFSGATPFGAMVGTVPVRLETAGPAIEVIPFDMTIEEPGLDVSPVPASVSVRVHSDSLPQQSATDDVESALSPWTLTGADGLDPTLSWRRIEASAANHRWSAPDPPVYVDQWLVSPPLQTGSGPVTIAFSHRYSFDTSGSAHLAGGVIEISDDGGASWSDIGPLATPSYDGTVEPLGAGNHLEGRMAWVGESPVYPAMSAVSIPLGAAYANRTILVRFRIGSGSLGIGSPGWEVDDIAFDGITNLPFSVIVAETTACADTDLDGHPDPLDCAPLDASTWAPIGEATGLVLTGHPTTLSWLAPAAAGTNAPLYDVLRSAADKTFSTMVCLETAGTDRVAQDPGLPGTAWFYLVRSRNGCSSNLGTRSSGAPRTAPPCP